MFQTFCIWILSRLFARLGSLLKVEIFPSQYGKEQLAKELERGPTVEKKKDVDVDDERDDENNNGKEYSNEALRKYQV